MDTILTGVGLCGLAGFAACGAIIPLVRRLARQRADVEQPRNFHHTHQTPIPRLGGIGLAVALLVVMLVALPASNPARLATNLLIIGGSLAMFGLGLWDDFRSLGAKFKLLAQVLIATGVYWGGIRIEVVGIPLSEGSLFLTGIGSWAATVFWLVALTNLINIIDGMDGLAGGIALMLMGLLAFVAFRNHPFATQIAVGMAGALVAFLYFNFPPAKIYMGDGGAYLLGFFIGVLTITTSHKGTIAAAMLAPIFALTLPITDVSLAIVRRGMKGLPIFRPDRRHIHHRLLDAGLSRRRAVLVLYGVSAVCALMACAVFWTQGKLVPVLLGVIFLCGLFAMRFLGFVQDWWELRNIFGTSLQLRKETRYALAMMAWLELEAERSKTLQELWGSYLFITRKLGFSQTRLALEQGTDFFWKHPPPMGSPPEQHHCRVELRLANVRAIEFTAERGNMSPTVFEQLTELAAEAWMKAVQRWRVAHNEEITFAPADSNIVALMTPGRVEVANAV